MSRTKAPVTPEDLDRARTLFEDGASQREVCRTTGIARETLRKYFPGQCWTYVQGGEQRWLERKAAEVLGGGF